MTVSLPSLPGPLRALLRWRIELGLAITLAVLAVIYLVWTDRSTNESLRLRLAESQFKNVRKFDTWFDEHVQQARDWADTPEARGMVRALLALPNATPDALNAEPLQAAFRAKFAQSAIRQGVQGYFVVSPQGISLGSLGADNTGTRNLLWAEPEFFEQMRKHGGAISPLMASDVRLQNSGAEIDGRALTLFVGVPIYLDGPEPAAYFTLRLPTIDLLAEQGQSRFGTGGVSWLVDRFGRVHADRLWLNVDLDAYGLASQTFRGRPYLFARDPGRNLLVEPGLLADRNQRALTRSAQAVVHGAGSTLEPYRDHRGARVIGSWTWDDKLGLGVITELPAGEAFASMARARDNVLIAVVLFAVAMVALLLKRLSRSRRALQAALINAESASRAKGIFLANMSHEIRTPLNAVLGIAHLLGNTPLSPNQREYLQMISSSGSTLLGTLNDILDYSKVEAGKLELLNAEFSIHDVVDTLSSIMSVNAAPKDLELVIGIEPEVPTQLIGDSQRVLQVLVNLTGNAIKFTQVGEVILHISVESRMHSDVVLRFAVRDTGMGITPEKQRLLFAPFTQADAGVTRDFGGSGLGLAICKRLVDLMRGQIGVRSTHGQGSEFWFTIPFVATDAPDPLPPRSATSIRNVLVVDDNDIARVFVSKSVERLGWRAHEATSGAEAVAAVSAKAVTGIDDAGGYDVLLIDGTMPNMDGLQTSKAIRALSVLPQPPIVIMVTALGRDKLTDASDSDAMDAVVAKPVTPSKIFDAVMEAQTKRRGGYTREKQPYAPARAINRLKSLRMLLVEDNYINQQVARGILEAEGAVITTADNGAVAVDLLKRMPDAFDLVLMDVQMPVMDGLEATRKIRRELNRTLPIVAMSAGVMQGERDVCAEAGMNDFIAKPLDPHLVVQTLRKLDLKTARETETPSEAKPSLRTRSGAPIIAGIEMDQLVDALNGNRRTAERLLLRLADECDGVIHKLDAAIADDNRVAVNEALHSFKGVTANMRAVQLAAQTAVLEASLREHGLVSLHELMPSFRLNVLALREAVLAAGLSVQR